MLIENFYRRRVNMGKVDISIEPKKVYQIITPVSFLILFAVVILYYFFIGRRDFSYIYINPIAFTISIIAAAILHEVIHALTFIIVGKVPKRKIKFGIILKYLTPYAYCSQVISISTYRTALLLPTIILGIIPIISGFLFKNFLLLLIGDFMLIGGFGDLLIIWNTRKLKKGTRVLDHDKKVGCYIVKKQSP